jgi:hypothetical protein
MPSKLSFAAAACLLAAPAVAMPPGMSWKAPVATKASTLSLKSPDGASWAKVSLSDSGLAFTSSKCVDRTNWCGAYKSAGCAPSSAAVVSKVEMPGAKGKILYLRLHQDGTLAFDVPDGQHSMTGYATMGCVDIVKSDYVGVAQGLMFSTPTAGRALVTHSTKGAAIHCARGFTVDGAAL